MSFISLSLDQGLAMVFNATAQRLLHAPALSTPPGVQRHMSTHSPEQAGVYVCSVLVAVVPGTLLCLRLYTKIRILKRTDLTDCTHQPLPKPIVLLLTFPRSHRYSLCKPSFGEECPWLVANNVSTQLMLIVMLAMGRFCLSTGGGAHQWNISLEQFHRVVFVRRVHPRMGSCELTP